MSNISKANDNCNDNTYFHQFVLIEVLLAAVSSSLDISGTILVSNSALLTCLPLASVTVRLKCWIPGELKVRVMFSPVSVIPSLNSHSNVYGGFPPPASAAYAPSSPTASIAL
jgi:hypothetical protein